MRSDGTETGQARRKRLRLLATLVSLTFAGLTLLCTPAAQAAPAPTISDVTSKVKKLRQEVSAAGEDYVEAQEKLKSTKVRLAASKKKQAQQEKQVAAVRRQLGQLAADSYRQGELGTLELLLSDDPDSLLARSGYVQSLSDQQNAVLAQLAQAQKNLKETQRSIKQQRSEAEAQRTKMRKARNTARKQLAAAEAQLAQLEAAERARVEAAVDGDTVSASSASCAGTAVDAPSDAAATAIEFACDQLGDAYVWAAAGPDTWDCSGLTMMAYAEAGITLPHSSRLQATYGTSVSISALEPGDLVFFYSPISHVGIYLGDDTMVDAPSSGDVVKVQTLWQTPTAAVRLS